MAWIARLLMARNPALTPGHAMRLARSAAIAGAALLALLLLLMLSQCQNARQAGRQAAVEREQGRAVVDNAADAIGAVGAVYGRDTGGDDLTRSNRDAIQNADGADAPANPAVRDAGLDSLCRRAAYRGSEQCLQRAAARRVEAGR